MSSETLVYYTVFGGDVFYDNLRCSIDALRDFGEYTGDVLVFSDRAFTYRRAQNVVLSLPDAPESVAIRIACYRYFDFAAYRRVLFLDADILACRPVAPVFGGDALTYFPQDDRYGTTGAIDALYFDAATFWRNVWKHPLNAGQFVVSGSEFETMMRVWEGV